MLRFQLTNSRERQEFEHLEGPIEFGRGPQRDTIPRCVVQDLYVSKDHVHVCELDNGRIRIENLSKRNSIRLLDDSIIAIGTSRDLEPPIRLMVGETAIDVERIGEDPPSTQLHTVAVPLAAKVAQQPAHSLLDLGRSPSPETLAHWFETVIAVQRAAAGSPEFYYQTARAIVDLVGLDRGLILLRRNGRWMAQARFPDPEAPTLSPGLGSKGSAMLAYTPRSREFSLGILEQVERERRTLFQSGANMASSSESLKGVEAVVASPIFDPRDQQGQPLPLAGVVYGCRTRFTPHTGVGVGPLEAQVMQLLASTVSVGLARLEREAEVSRLRVQFEQFFSADLARELEKNPRLLEGQEREVTVLFSDIRGFSALSEKLGPTDTCRLVSDVMERLTERVREFDGVVVDYAGDGLMAMWNAPCTQPDHAARAARAALAMLADLPLLDADWQQRLGAPLRLGIGLNTGPALCGNTGSRQKFKYGALGHTVNLGSRVEGATKQLGVPLLITGSTRAQLGNTFAARRLCKARVVGIGEAVDLYELYAESASPEWLTRRDNYEKALGLYEAGNCRGTCQTLGPLLVGQQNYDIPSLTLMGWAIEALRSPPDQFDSVFDLMSK